MGIIYRPPLPVFYSVHYFKSSKSDKVRISRVAETKKDDHSGYTRVTNADRTFRSDRGHKISTRHIPFRFSRSLKS